ncbi:XRE family transcriptional regulator, partial [Escherichia coli]|nr:XRE family transcriptional regulator [Escherichia coli]
DNLIDGKNIFAKTHGMNNVMRKFIDGKLGSVLDKEFDDIIMKYATFYMVVAKNLRDDLI